ncbi:DUF295 domain-containing protein [Actinomadura spongiicola]|uniref:DUF295 domain-containing protein n=1 Tax=Actinomadura spongiicola TaxID=2303421 RepID=A0A372GPU4_9ACTN|nr:DUF295 domain-containing protein [Actinomadura spongiicola]
MVGRSAGAVGACGRWCGAGRRCVSGLVGDRCLFVGADCSRSCGWRAGKCPKGPNGR